VLVLQHNRTTSDHKHTQHQGSPIGGYCLAPTNPSNNGGIRAATTLVYRRCQVETSYLQICTFFRKVKPCFIIQGRLTKVVKNSRSTSTQRACRSAVFTSLNNVLNDKCKTDGFGHTQFSPDNDDIWTVTGVAGTPPSPPAMLWPSAWYPRHNFRPLGKTNWGTLL